MCVVKERLARNLMIDEAYPRFRDEVGSIAQRWAAHGLPSRQRLDQRAAEIGTMRNRLTIAGLWTQPPCMVTATLDDGLGQGLAIIETFASAVGMRLVRLGLLRTPEEIVTACHREIPDFLGLTVLQFDTEEQLSEIGRHLPRHTRMIAGGPVYAADRGFAVRTGTHYAARHVADFLQYMVADAAATTPDG